jgi:hypothetical protein
VGATSTQPSSREFPVSSTASHTVPGTSAPAGIFDALPAVPSEWPDVVLPTTTVALPQWPQHPACCTAVGSIGSAVEMAVADPAVTTAPTAAYQTAGSKLLSRVPGAVGGPAATSAAAKPKKTVVAPEAGSADAASKLVHRKLDMAAFGRAAAAHRPLAWESAALASADARVRGLRLLCAATAAGRIDGDAAPSALVSLQPLDAALKSSCVQLAVRVMVDAAGVVLPAVAAVERQLAKIAGAPTSGSQLLSALAMESMVLVSRMLAHVAPRSAAACAALGELGPLVVDTLVAAALHEDVLADNLPALGAALSALRADGGSPPSPALLRVPLRDPAYAEVEEVELRQWALEALCMLARGDHVHRTFDWPAGTGSTAAGELDAPDLKGSEHRKEPSKVKTPASLSAAAAAQAGPASGPGGKDAAKKGAKGRRDSALDAGASVPVSAVFRSPATPLTDAVTSPSDVDCKVSQPLACPCEHIN